MKNKEQQKIYCEDCGNKLTEFFSGKYNPVTGTKIMEKFCTICNTDLCMSEQGVYLDHKYDIADLHFFGTSYVICSRCGKKSDEFGGY